ncbi:MAG: CvpA family protein [Clostridia bacterium]|nr:CvpA family protein [Clostridia bacterium]
MASLIIDSFYVLTLIVLPIRYAKKGFVRSVLDFAKTLLAIFLAVVLRVPVAKWLDSLFMNNGIVGWVRTSLLETQSGADPFINFVSIYDDFPSFYSVILKAFGLDTDSIIALGSIDQATPEMIEALSNSIGSAISYMLSTVLAVLIVFVIFIIIFTVIIHALDLLTRFSFIRWLNRALGLCFGVAIAGCIIIGISVAIAFLVKYIGPYNSAFSIDIIDKSVFMSLIRQYDVLKIAGIEKAIV